MIRQTITILALIGLCACSYPQTSVEQGSAPSAVYVQGAPANASVWIDGQDVGPAEKLNTKKTAYALASGRHHIILKGPSGTLLEKDVYVETGATIAVELMR